MRPWLALLFAVAISVTAGAAARADVAVARAQALPGTIAFSAGAGAHGQPYRVFVARPNGTILQVTHRAGGRLVPGAAIWSPDGSQLLVTNDDGIYVVHADGSSEISLAGLASIYEPARWSPDNRRIGFQQGNAIYVVNADGSGGLRRLASDAGASWGDWSWSPDGARIAFVGGSAKAKLGLFLVNTSGAPHPKQVRLEPALQTARGEVTAPPSPIWSPDGSRIAFDCCSALNQENWIYTTRVDGTGVRRLHRGWLDSWSPDGTRIAFGSGIVQTTGLYVMAPDGSGVRRLPGRGGGNLRWFSDGTRIAYWQPGAIYVIHTDGSGRRLVARTHSRFAGFALSPDDSTIAYVDGRGRDYNRNVYVVGVDGSGRRLVAHSSAMRYWNPSWRPAGR